MEDPLVNEIAQFEQQLEKLHRGFEQYFIGLERVPPVDDRDRLHKRLLDLRSRAAKASTATRFRGATLWARFLSYDQLWTRTLKQIEDGTYRRILQRIRRRDKRPQEASGDRPAIPEETPATVQELARAGARAAPPPDTSATNFKMIYDVYMQARRRTGESTRVSLESLAKQLQQRAIQMQQKNKCDAVDFKVVIKGGKALIKAIPKRS